MHKRRLPIVLLSLFFGCVGCHAPMKTVTLEVPLPEVFSQSGGEVLPERWWQVLGDPNLNAVIEEALHNNFTIRSAWDRLYQAEQTAFKAGAALRPDVHYSGSAGRSREDTHNTMTYEAGLLIGLTVSYEVDLWGKGNAQHKLALLDIEARQEDLAAAAIILSATIAKTWVQLAEAKKQVAILARQIATNEEILEIVRLQFQKGAVSAPDVLRQRQLVVATRGRLVQANETVTLLQHQLSLLLGRPPETRWADQVSGLIEPADLPQITVPSELIRRRPDVVSAYKAVQRADQQVAVAVADLYPSIRLSADARTTSTRIEDLFDDWAASLAGSLVGPLFDAGLRRAEAKRTRGALSAAIHTYTQTVLQALKEVEDALHKESSQRQYVRTVETQRTLATQAYERIRHQYIHGQLDYLCVLEFLVPLQSLERSEVTARRAWIEYRIDLCRAIAGSWDMERTALACLDEPS